MKQYLFPIITVLILMLFYLGIPDFDGTEIETGRGRLGRIDYLFMIAITVIFAFVDFSVLGDRSDPQTFEFIPENPAYLTLSEESKINKIVFYTGVGTGNYTIDFSSDNENWITSAGYNQESGSVLKWQTIIPEYNYTNVKYVRISSYGSTYLGEVFLLDEDSNIIPFFSSEPALNDEQDQLRLEQTHMNSSYFDEIYHVRTAWEHLNKVYPYEISHPPLGKIIISIGIALLGMTPFGWRFSGTLFGVLMLPLVYVLIKRMFNSTKVSLFATLVLATDFMHFVQTRIATIDTYAVFFIILMYLFMYRYITEDKLKYLALSGVFFGFGAACKWTCIYAGAGLAVIWLAYRMNRIREGFIPFIKNCLFCIVFFILVPSVIYYLSYIPYALAQNIQSVFTKDYLQLVINNQEFMYSYHSRLVAEHPYSSKWYQWVFNIRPILYYLQYNPDGTRQSFGAFLNPMLCWGGLVALFLLLYYAVFRKEKTAAFILVGYLAQLVPWIFVTRLTFEYHYFPSSVFLVLALAYVFYLMEKGNRKHILYICSFTAVSIALFIMFFPVLSGIPIKEEVQRTLLSWLPTWPF